VVSKKRAILRVQLEIPTHTTLNTKSLSLSGMQSPPPFYLNSGNLNGTFSLWCNILTSPFSALAGNDWDNLALVTSRRVKRQYGCNHQQKEGFKCGGKG
jgi:hypothetical protein